MLRLRLAATLLSSVLLAVWVYYDARTRGARKPLFAAGLTLLWGPLGLGFWASDRPLADGERRAGGAGWTMAKLFAAEPAGPDRVRWQHLSSSRAELPVP